MPTFLLDDREIEFNPGDTVIAAAERSGVDIPHYCWHPGLSTAANCRMCLVEVLPPEGRPALLLDVLKYDEDKGDYVLARKPKLQPACQLGAAAGMRIKSQTSEHAVEARAAIQEFLLLNHPVDCPICDQAGECRLQDYWLEHSGKKKRMTDEILHRPKAVDFGQPSSTTPNVASSALAASAFVTRSWATMSWTSASAGTSVRSCSRPGASSTTTTR